MTLPLIHSLFEQVAAERADAVAIAGEAGMLTYGALNRSANGVAITLRPHLSARGGIVGLLLSARARTGHCHAWRCQRR